MAKVYLMLADGFEEAEAIVPFDILHRSRVEVEMISVTGKSLVTSSHGVPVVASRLIEEADFSDGDMLFLPGGVPGAMTLAEHPFLAEVIRKYHQEGKWLAAICAAPRVYGLMGLLEGKKATCYPGFENELLGAVPEKKTCVRDGQFITACGAGAAYALGREMASVLVGESTADAVLRQMMYNVYE